MCRGRALAWRWRAGRSVLPAENGGWDSRLGLEGCSEARTCSRLQPWANNRRFDLVPPRAGDREAAARVPKAIGATALRFAAVASARLASRPVHLHVCAAKPRVAYSPRVGAANDRAALSLTPTWPARPSRLRTRPRGRPLEWAAASPLAAC